jgi:hypothetical protein
MSEACLPVAQFATAVLRAEIAEGDGIAAGAARHVMKRFYRRVSERLGAVGCDVLFARSLALAQRERPLLAEVMAGPGGTLSGLDEAVPDGNSAQEVVIAILSCFIEQLSSLIGEDLMLRLLREVKPEPRRLG